MPGEEAGQPCQSADLGRPEGAQLLHPPLPGRVAGRGREEANARACPRLSLPHSKPRKLRFRVFKACGDSGKQLRKLFALSSRGEETPARLPAKLSLLGGWDAGVFGEQSLLTRPAEASMCRSGVSLPLFFPRLGWIGMPGLVEPDWLLFPAQPSLRDFPESRPGP